MCVEQSQIAHDHELRDHSHLRGDHQRGNIHEQQKTATAIMQLGKGKCGHGTGEQLQCQNTDGNLQ